MKVAGQHTQAKVREQPASHLAIDFRGSPVALFGDGGWLKVQELFGKTGECRVREFRGLYGRDCHRSRCGVHEQIVAVDVSAEFWCHSNSTFLLPCMLVAPATNQRIANQAC